MVELLCSILPCVLYAGDSGVFFSLAYEYSTTSNGNSGGMFCTLVVRVTTLIPGMSLCNLGDAVAVGMAPVDVVVVVVIMKNLSDAPKHPFKPKFVEDIR